MTVKQGLLLPGLKENLTNDPLYFEVFYANILKLHKAWLFL
jgi:hypothetical protein